MAEHEGISRTPMVFPGHQAVVDVTDDQVETYLAQGWKKLRSRRSADTGSIPQQQANR